MLVFAYMAANRSRFFVSGSVTPDPEGLSKSLSRPRRALRILPDLKFRLLAFRSVSPRLRVRNRSGTENLPRHHISERHESETP